MQHIRLAGWLKSLILLCGCVLLCYGTKVRIAVLAPENGSLPYSRERIMPAIELAISKIKEMGDLGPLPGVEIQLMYFDTECDSVRAGLVSFEIQYKGLADVFFGPICSYAVAPVSRYSSVWNIPVLTVDARSMAFDGKEIYRLLTRVNGAYYQLRNMVITFLNRYDWKRVLFLFHQAEDKKSGNSECYFQLGPISTGLSKDNVYYETFDENDPAFDVMGILKAVKKKARSNSFILNYIGTEFA
ncbi:Atrial natriuretic peptide receptor 1 [Nymphon striatum]|nr:Atrial natriuretic peptide receptor 1 [Nymphon striatum]